MTGVRCTRCERPICSECMIPASVGFQCPDDVREGNRGVRRPQGLYGGAVARGAVVTQALIAVNVVVFLIGVAGGAGFGGGNENAPIYRHFALVPGTVAAQHEWYRLVTAMFLHFGVLHIAFNMYALLIMGPPLEAMLGRVRYTVLYFLAGIGGSMLSFLIGPVSEVAAGASGAIFGVFGAFYVLLRQRHLQTGQVLGLIAINLVFSFTFSGIDWRGHVGGLVVGAVVAAVYAYAPRGAQRTQVQVLGVAAVALVLAAAGFVGAAHVRGECKDAVDPYVTFVCYQLD